jgi:hypothetical protein
MTTSILPVNLTWSEVYDLAAFYREKMQRFAEHAHFLPNYAASLKADMHRYAEEAAAQLHKWDAILEAYHHHAIYQDIAA